MDENNKSSADPHSTTESEQQYARSEQSPYQAPENASSESAKSESVQENEQEAAEDPQVAIEKYEETASSTDSHTYSREPEGSSGVHVAPATINSPFHALQAIILKPNPVFAKLKTTHNWSWLPFFVVVFFSALPSWLYFNTVDLNWYTDLMIELHYSDVSPSEQDQARQMFMQDNMAAFSAFSIFIGLVIMYSIFALYLYKTTQVDDENILGFGDWYGFMWWAALPFAIFGLITALIILVAGGPEMRPELLAPFSLSTLLGLSMGSAWYSWAQGVSIDVVWVIYLMAVGVSQWTKLNTKQCYIVASAPFAIIWGVWAVFIIF